MGYVPGFEHDIFLSYAWVNNTPRAGEKKGWVSQFGDDLASAIDERIGRKNLVSFWRDRRLEGNEDFDDAVRHAVHRSALFLPVLSPGYIQSAYCLSEAREFAQQKPRLFLSRLGDKTRVFKVQCSHLAPEYHPAGMQGLIGYSFHEYNQEQNIETRWYATQHGNPNDRYYDLIAKLAGEAGDMLSRMARRATIYVAETEDVSLLADRAKLVRRLRSCDFRVLPEDRIEPALFGPEDNIRADLNRSALSVHLVGARYGKPLAEGRSRSHMAFDLAAGRFKDRIPPFVWRRDSANSAIEPEQQDFIEALYNEGPDRLSAEQFSELGELSEAILHKTFPHLVEPISPSLRRAANPLVHISYQPMDRAQYDVIQGYLASEACDSVASDAESLGDQELMTLKHCAGMVIVYGEAPAKWVKNLAVQAREVAAERLRKFSIVEGPPEAKEELGLSFGSLLVVNCRNGLRPELLKDFVTAIRS